MAKYGRLKVAEEKVTVEKLGVHSLLEPLVELELDILSSLPAKDLTLHAVDILLITQPIIVVEEHKKFLCVCGLKSLIAVKTHVSSLEEVKVFKLIGSSVSEEELSKVILADWYLKSMLHQYKRNDQGKLAKLYDMLGKNFFQDIAPVHSSKSKFARDLGVSRQSVFYDDSKK